MNDNLKLWDSFGKTDPKYTKAANVDGNKQTSLSGNYMVKLATESLGAIGEGWGYKILNERFDNTKPIMTKVDNKLELMKDGDSIIWEQDHTLLIEMWHGNKESTFTQFGHTKYRYMKTDGSKMIIDHEYAKKSLTDAMKKCLSLIGVCSDVFMGEFDDVNYQQVAKIENDLKNAENKDLELSKKVLELTGYIEKNIKAMEMCPTFESMLSVADITKAKIEREGPVLGLNIDHTKAPLDSKFFELKEKFDKEDK